MSQHLASGLRTFRAGAQIDQHLRVKLSSGKLVKAGLGEDDFSLELGTTDRHAAADDELVTVRLRNCDGTCKMIAAGAIDQGAAVYGALNGKISSTVSGDPVGVALEAATADGDVIEVARRR